MFCRALAMRIISVWRPSMVLTTGCSENKILALGSEKRANITPVIKATLLMPIKISTVATACAYSVAGCISP